MINYNGFMKAAEKVTKAVSGARPILKGVHHAENGDLYVTDSHRLYIAEKAQNVKDGSTVCPKTGAKIDGNFPQVARLLPGGPSELTVILNVAEALKAAKALQACGKVFDKMPLFTLDNGSLKLTGNTGAMAASYELRDVVGSEDSKVTMRAAYLIEALELFKDCSYPEVSLDCYGNNRPFTLGKDTGLTAVIMPVRQ